jgi:hypothetical protein
VLKWFACCRGYESHIFCPKGCGPFIDRPGSCNCGIITLQLRLSYTTGGGPRLENIVFGVLGACNGDGLELLGWRVDLSHKV